MQRLDRYLLTQCVRVVVGLTTLALGVFLLERLLRIFELVSNTSDTIGAATRMILNLIPYYLSLAFPIALFLGVLVTIDRVSRTGELSAALAAGVSLFQVSRPFLLIAVVLSAATLIIGGFLQPLGRYDYRATVDRVEQTSLEAAFQEGKFAQIGRRVFWTEDRSNNDRLGNIFILERREGGQDIEELVTAPSGRVSKGIDSTETRITLDDAVGLLFMEDSQEFQTLSSRTTDWNVEGDITRFRNRGDDERELTLYELIVEATTGRFGLVEPHVAAAAAHTQIARALILLLLPFVAIPMGLGYGRSFQSTGIAAGIIFLLVVQKSLESGQTMAAEQVIAPWMGAWPIFGVVALVAGWLFLRSATTVATPPLMMLSFDLGGTVTGLWTRLIDLFRRVSTRMARPMG